MKAIEDNLYSSAKILNRVNDLNKEDLFKFDSDGRTVLMIAAKLGKFEIVKALIEKVPEMIFLTSKTSGDSAIDYAKRFQDTCTVEQKLDYQKIIDLLQHTQDSYHSAVTLYPKLIDVAYKVKSKDNDSDKALEIQKNSGFEVILYSIRSGDHDYASYRAVAFLNKDTKQVVIANAGTNPYDPNDLLDDILISKDSIKTNLLNFFGGQAYSKDNSKHEGTKFGKYISKYLDNVASLPYKTASIENFNIKLLEKMNNLGIDLKECSFQTTGHSLGGILSDISAAHLSKLGCNVERSVTFENPGSKHVMEAYMGVDSLNNLDTIFTVYNNAPNLITSVNQQLGNVYSSHGNKQVKDCLYFVNKDQNDNILKYLTSKLDNYLGTKVGGYLKVVEMIDNLYHLYVYGTNTLKGHSLSNFKNFNPSNSFNKDNIPFTDIEGMLIFNNNLSDFLGSDSIASDDLSSCDDDYVMLLDSNSGSGELPLSGISQEFNI